MIGKKRIITLVLILTLLTALPALAAFLTQTEPFAPVSFLFFKEILVRLQLFIVFLNLIIIKAIPGCRVNPNEFGTAVCEGGFWGLFLHTLADILAVVLGFGLVFLFWFLIVTAFEELINWLLDRDL